jgi:hypothetical protein
VAWPDGGPSRRRRKADSPGATTVGAGGQAAEHARRYEQARQAATAGAADGWRHGLGVLAAKGVAYWMATWSSLTPTDAQPLVGTTTQAEPSLSTTTPLPAHQPEGGELSGSACTSFLPQAADAVVAVLAQMTLAHARSPM